MKKNSKGFTLIELLAVIVILGILFVFSIPLVTGMVERGRNKIYISDAEKLVSQAEYRIRSSSSEIEKPDPGDAIAISLLYLDNAEFDSPPNGGKYQKENSFVIIKNVDNGKLEYSVTLVEKMKRGGYKGVELTSKNELLAKNSTRHVVIFNEEDLIDIDDLQPSDLKKLNNGGDYVTSISNRYNNPSLKDDSSTEVSDAKPKIDNADLVSASDKSFLTLDAKLVIKADDKDTSRKDLKICYSTEANYCDKLSNFIDYGNKTTFTKEINFKGRYNYGDNIKMYVAVVDPQRNIDKKTIEKSFHINVAPEIDNASIDKREIDKYADTIATVRVSVNDDLDNLSNLQVCLAETDTPTAPNSCSGGYKKFTEYFNNDGENAYTKDYQFKCGGTCKRNGTKHYLTIFVKDTDGLETTKTLEYQFSENYKPTLEIKSIESVNYETPSNGNRHVIVNVIGDDIDGELSDLTFTISDSEGKNSQTYTSSADGFNSFDYVFDSSFKYNGAVKTLMVKVEDKEGGSNIASKTYQLYKNTAPSIDDFSIFPTGEACDANKDLCPVSEGGNDKPALSVYVSDDLDSSTDNNLKVCVSDNASYCNDSSHYVKYSDKFENNLYEYTINNPVYNGQEKTFYAYAMDSYGAKSEVKTAVYKLYEDKVPQIELFTVNSVERDNINDGNLTINYQINAVDDFQNSNELQFELLLKNGNNYTTLINRTALSNYINKENNEITLPGTYDGKTRYIVARVYDKKNVIDANYNERIIEYSVYKKNAITEDDIYFAMSSDSPCNNSACSDDENGSLDVNYQLSIPSVSSSDYSNVSVCVSETEGCTSYSKLSNYMEDDGSAKVKDFRFSPTNSSKPYDGSTKKLYIYIRDDTDGDLILGVDTLTLVREHIIYKNNKPVVLVQPTVSATSNSSNLNLNSVKYSLSVADDFDDSSALTTTYCKKEVNANGTDGAEVCNSTYSGYVDEIVLDNSFFNISRYEGQKFKIYSKIKDSYGAEVKTNEVLYEMYKDEAPDITSINGVYDAEYDDDGKLVSSSNYRVGFKAIDQLDTYTYCISNSNSTCSTYSTTSISGDDQNYHIATISDISDTNATLYLYLKDASGKVSSRSFTFEDYISCKYEAYGTSKYTYSDLDSSKTYYYYDNDDDDVDEDDSSYEVDEDKTCQQIPGCHEISGSSYQKISMDYCSGKCYKSYSENNDKFGYYLLKVTYKDAFDTSISCDTSNGDSNNSLLYKAGCDYKDCFKKNNKYATAIGIDKNTDPIGFTYDDGGTPKKCYEYYDEYISSYAEGDANITLTKTPNKICATLVDRGDYNYNSSSSNPYVRVDVSN